MIAACARAGVKLLIGTQRRFTRRYMEIRTAIERGDIGRVRLLRENERCACTEPQIWRTRRTGPAIRKSPAARR